MSDLKAIFFDVDDTLYSTSDFARRARENAVDSMIRLGLKMRKEPLIKELDEVISEFTSNYEHHFDQLLARLPAHCYSGLNPAFLVASAIIAYHDTKMRDLKPHPDARRALEVLSRTPLILGVITAGLKIKQAEKLLRLGLYQYFVPTALFISDQIGISKPNVKLYQRACMALNILPSEALYVGDNPTHDIDPPNQIGMITVRMKRGGRYSEIRGATEPTYELTSFDDLLTVLSGDFGVDLPLAKASAESGEAKA
jgi:putative hydrolase of the HAD superfamily